MAHFASSKFWQAYAKLPAPARQLADKNFALLKQKSADTHHYISRKSGDFGAFASVCIIVQSQPKWEAISVGMDRAARRI